MVKGLAHPPIACWNCGSYSITRRKDVQPPDWLCKQCGATNFPKKDKHKPSSVSKPTLICTKDD